MEMTNTDIRRTLSPKQRKDVANYLTNFITAAKEKDWYVGATCNHVWNVWFETDTGITREDAYRLEDAYRRLTGALTNTGFSAFTKEQWSDMSTHEKNNYRVSKLEQFCEWLLEEN